MAMEMIEAIRKDSEKMRSKAKEEFREKVEAAIRLLPCFGYLNQAGFIRFDAYDNEIMVTANAFKELIDGEEYEYDLTPLSRDDSSRYKYMITTEIGGVTFLAYLTADEAAKFGAA